MRTTPRPAGALYDIRAAALMVARSPKRIRNVLYEHRDLFDPPRYDQRRRGGRLHRVLTAAEMRTLLRLFPLRVK